MKIKRESSLNEVGLLAAGGIILTIGSIWWLRGFPVACLVLGILLLVAAWSCLGED